MLIRKVRLIFFFNFKVSHLEFSLILLICFLAGDEFMQHLSDMNQERKWKSNKKTP
jgi:hypothetical protein